MGFKAVMPLARCAAAQASEESTQPTKEASEREKRTAKITIA